MHSTQRKTQVNEEPLYRLRINALGSVTLEPVTTATAEAANEPIATSLTCQELRGISPRHLRDLVKSGKVAGWQATRGFACKLADLDSYLAERTKRTERPSDVGAAYERAVLKAVAGGRK